MVAFLFYNTLKIEKNDNNLATIRMTEKSKKLEEHIIDTNALAATDV
jgi:hypothetical protein